MFLVFLNIGHPASFANDEVIAFSHHCASIDIENVKECFELIKSQADIYQQDYSRYQKIQVFARKDALAILKYEQDEKKYSIIYGDQTNLQDIAHVRLSFDGKFVIVTQKNDSHVYFFSTRYQGNIPPMKRFSFGQFDPSTFGGDTLTPAFNPYTGIIMAFKNSPFMIYGLRSEQIKSERRGPASVPQHYKDYTISNFHGSDILFDQNRDFLFVLSDVEKKVVILRVDATSGIKSIVEMIDLSYLHDKTLKRIVWSYYYSDGLEVVDSNGIAHEISLPHLLTKQD